MITPSKSEKVTYSKLIHAHLRIEKLEKEVQGIKSSRDCAYDRQMRFESSLADWERENSDMQNQFDYQLSQIGKLTFRLFLMMIAFIPVSLVCHVALWWFLNRLTQAAQ